MKRFIYNIKKWIYKVIIIPFGIEDVLIYFAKKKGDRKMKQVFKRHDKARYNLKKSVLHMKNMGYAKDYINSIVSGFYDGYYVP